MMQDLAAILVLIAITCSGFFVAFTLSFGRKISDGSSVAYTLFQVLMGYTPAAWEIWDDYNILGRALLTLFLVICHFLVVTILLTVLTNSFMAIVKNAEEEHQFLFAVNVLSMVKSDALFSYIAPSNIIGWMCSPLRHVMPFRSYVKVNRTLIKLTHFPITFLIFAYERVWLASSVVEPVELVKRGGQDRGRLATFQQAGGQDHFAPSVRVREPSVTTRYKDRALEEVFRRPYKGDTSRTMPPDRPETAVDSWINNMGDIASPPPEQARSVLDQLEVQGPKARRSMTSLAISSKRRAASASAISDNDDGRSRSIRPRPRLTRRMRSGLSREVADLIEATEEDLEEDEDESLANDDDDENPSLTGVENRDDIFGQPAPRKLLEFGLEEAKRRMMNATNPTMQPTTVLLNRAGHSRQESVNTIVFNPIQENSPTITSPRDSMRPPRTPSRPRKDLRPSAVPVGKSNRPTAQRGDQLAGQAFRSRPNLRQRNTFQSVPAIDRLQMQHSHSRDPSYDTVALDLASDIGDNRHIAEPDSTQLYGSSFNVHMDFASAARRKERREQLERAEEAQMLSRIVLTRMNTLEEGFKDILKEVKELRASSRPPSDADSGSGGESRRRNKTHTPRDIERRLQEDLKVEFRQSTAVTDQSSTNQPDTLLSQAGTGGR